MISLKSFKKISDDGNKAVLQHVDGHEIHVSKKSLPSALNKQLAELPLHKAEGGEVEESSDESSSDQPQAPININIGQPQGQGLLQAAGPQGQPIAPQASDQGIAPNIQAQAPAQPKDPFESVPGYTEQKQAAQLGSQATSQEAQTIADAAHYKQAQDYKDSQQVSRALADKQNEIDAVTQDIKNGHINPNQYLENMSVPSKISTAIGLIMGGIGSGLTGQGNPALQFLNAQIDRNLNSQKVNMDQQHNLLSALGQQYHSEMERDAMFRAINANLLADQMQEAAAKSGDLKSKANLLNAMGTLKQQYLAPLQQMEWMKVATGQGPESQGISNAQKLEAEKKAGFIDDKQYEAATKQLDTNEQVEQLRSNLKNSYHDINNKLLGGAFSPAERSSAINAYSGVLEHLAEGRFNFEEAKQQVESILPSRFESEETTANKLERLDNLLDGFKPTSVLKGVGINVNKGESTKYIKVISPNGKTGVVPRHQLKTALSKGFTQQ